MFLYTKYFYGRRGNAPTRKYTHIFENVIIFIGMLKTVFFLTISFLYLIYSLGGYIIGIKPTPGDHKSNFKKGVEIPCGCNTK